jgi:flagellar basal body rod protein FlgB
MDPSAITIELAAWAMRLEQARVQSASYNIATANVPGNRPTRVDFAAQLGAMRAALGSPDAELTALLGRDVAAVPRSATAAPVALDEEVANLAEAELRYKTLAEALARQFAVHSLAASGRQ